MNECDDHPGRASSRAFLRLCCALLAAALLPPAQAQTAMEYNNAAAAVPGRQKAPKQPKQVTAAQPAAVPDAGPEVAPAKKKPAASRTATKIEVPLCSTEAASPLPVSVTVGKSTLLKLPAPIARRTLGDEDVVQAALLSPQVLYLLGIEPGATNMILQDRAGKCTLVDVVVAMDAGALQSQLVRFFPEEKKLTASAAADTLVLSGTVADATKVDRILELARAYVRRGAGGAGAGGAPGGAGGGGGAAGSGQIPRIVNMLGVADPQQVLLEVKVAEVSKTLLDSFGLNFSRIFTSADGTLLRVISGILGGDAGILGQLSNAIPGATASTSADAISATATPSVNSPSAFSTRGSAVGGAGSGTTLLKLNAEKQDALIKILAEPTVMATSGQEGSFLAGGKIFIPVAQGGGNTGPLTITLEEQDFGIGLRFTPTVLDGGRINLKVAPEVSELAPQGVAISAPGVGGTTIMPLITTRRAATTVQLYDGQSFAIGGLIKNNVTQNINAFPILGEIPVLGALFRSSAFQTDRSELLIIVTPHLAKPLDVAARLPTDTFIEPTRSEFFLGGKMEGTPPQQPQPPQPAQHPALPAAPQGGFELQK